MTILTRLGKCSQAANFPLWNIYPGLTSIHENVKKLSIFFLSHSLTLFLSFSLPLSLSLSLSHTHTHTLPLIVIVNHQLIMLFCSWSNILECQQGVGSVVLCVSLYA